MGNMKESLKGLAYKVTGKKSKGESVSNVLDDIASFYADKKVHSNSVSDAIEAIAETYKKPEGKIEITSTAEVNVAEYETAQVVDEDLVAYNIRAGVSILGVEGNLEPDKPDQTKTVSPSTVQQTVQADTGYELASVVVEAVSLQDKTVSPSTSAQQVSADGNYNGLGTVTVQAVTSAIDSNIAPENIKQGVTILGVTGSMSGGGAVYGLTDLQTTLPNSLWNACAVRFGNYAYIFGGRTNTSTTYQTAIHKFDTANETITTLTAVLPVALENMTGQLVGRYIYLFGGKGSSYSNKIYKFDTETETISTVSASLSSAGSYSSFKYGKYVYLFADSNLTPCKFNTEDETISSFSTAPVLAGSAIAQFGSVFYLFGGATSSYLNTILKYDAETDTLTTLSVTLPTVLANAALAQFADNVYLIGGLISSNTGTNTVYKFNVTSQTLTTLDVQLTDAKYRIEGTQIGNRFYGFGGKRSGTGTATPTNKIVKFTVDF